MRSDGCSRQLRRFALTSTWAPAIQRKEALADADNRLASDPDSLTLRFERACLLSEMGQNDQARQAYLDILRRAPTHLGALNNLGTLLCGTGYRRAARTAFDEAVRQHPNHPMAHVNLGNMFLEDGDLGPAREHYETAVALAPNFLQAHRGLGNLLAELGEEEAAARHHRLGQWDRRPTELPYRGEAAPISVLMLASGRRGDVPIRRLLDDKIFRTLVILPNVYDPSAPLPKHQIVVNAIGEADLCRQALERAVPLLDRSKAAIINSPSAVLATGRAANARLLQDVPGVVTPGIVAVSRHALAGQHSVPFGFPLLLRAPGFHNGRHFVFVDSAHGLRAALDELPGEELLAIQYLDARGADGKHRKYRVMIIGGRLYPLHLAISNNWKIHYVTADMTECPEHRAEEAKFLDDMPGVLGPPAIEALAEIEKRLGLDYAGVDFGLNAAGELLLFEANATMNVVPPDSDPRWDYRRPAVQRIEDAVRTMLLEKVRLS